MGFAGSDENEVETMQRAVLDELEKIAATASRYHGQNRRAGRRPLSVATLLQKEKDGTLYKPGPVDGPGRNAGDVPSRDAVEPAGSERRDVASMRRAQPAPATGAG